MYSNTEMQRDLDLLRSDYTKKTSENEAIVLEFGATVQQKENGIRALAVAFFRHPHIAHCNARIYGSFFSPAKAPSFGSGKPLNWNHDLFQIIWPWTKSLNGDEVLGCATYLSTL